MMLITNAKQIRYRFVLTLSKNLCIFDKRIKFYKISQPRGVMIINCYDRQVFSGASGGESFYLNITQIVK